MAWNAWRLQSLLASWCWGSAALPLSDVVQVAGPSLDRCVAPEQRLLACLNSSHFTRRSCATGELNLDMATPCRLGFECEASTGTCASDLATHLLRSVDFQLVQKRSVASEANSCSEDAHTDARDGKMLCELLYATDAVAPTFGHGLGNTWVTAPESQAGNVLDCDFSDAAGFRSCIGDNVAKQAALLTARSPHMLLSAGLMEYLSKSNLDDPERFEECCHTGSFGRWGPNTTCVPDVRTQCVQDYYVAWGKVYMDAGARAFFFGQARLTGWGRKCESDSTGCSRVSLDGVDGFAAVLRRLKAYAALKSYGRVYFAPQAASGFQLRNGTELADWVYGGQHMHSSQQWLVQPFGVSGQAPAKGTQWYGGSDWHDANRINNQNGLPVLLDFDNFSGDETHPDDIRRLASWPNLTRPAFVRNMWKTLRFYNPRATLSIPLSKAAGGNWPNMRPIQPQCYSGHWGSNDGLYFGGVSCNLVNVTKELFAGEAHASPMELLTGVDTGHFGTALQSRDLLSVWAFHALLGRDFGGASEYNASMQSLPGLVIGARGVRCELAKTILKSPEFLSSSCDSRCVQQRLDAFLCLNRPECSGSVQSDELDLDKMCEVADSLSLFGNAALLDPSWHLYESRHLEV